MPRHRAYFPRDESLAPDSDTGWAGVNMRLSPAQVPAGLASGAVNKRFIHGVAETRRGIKKLAWSNVIVDPDDPVITPFNRIWGVGVFNDPDDREWIVIAADGGTYRCRESNCSVAIPLPAGVTITSPVTFTQCFNVLIMFRGPDLEPLILDNVSTGWTLASAQTVESAPEMFAPNTQPMPFAESGEAFQNRLIIPHDRDLVAVSDILDYTRYAPAEGAYRINQGSADRLVRIIKFNETALVAFKEGSVYLIGNLIPDEDGNFSVNTLDEVTNQYGCKAPKSVVRIGSDVWFLADRRGVSSIRQTEVNKVQAVDVPISDAIQPLIDRINWFYAHLATAAYDDNKYFIAVPLDGARQTKANLINGLSYNGTGQRTFTVKAGRTYRWTPARMDTALHNGTTVLEAEEAFEAVSNTVTLHGTVNAAVTAMLQEEVVGNNAVLVYDFLNKQWAGYDISREVGPTAEWGDDVLAVRAIITHHIETEEDEPILTEEQDNIDHEDDGNDPLMPEDPMAPPPVVPPPPEDPEEPLLEEPTLVCEVGTDQEYASAYFWGMNEEDDPNEILSAASIDAHKELLLNEITVAGGGGHTARSRFYWIWSPSLATRPSAHVKTPNSTDPEDGIGEMTILMNGAYTLAIKVCI